MPLSWCFQEEAQGTASLARLSVTPVPGLTIAGKVVWLAGSGSLASLLGADGKGWKSKKKGKKKKKKRGRRKEGRKRNMSGSYKRLKISWLCGVHLSSAILNVRRIFSPFSTSSSTYVWFLSQLWLPFTWNFGSRCVHPASLSPRCH